MNCFVFRFAALFVAAAILFGGVALAQERRAAENPSVRHITVIRDKSRTITVGTPIRTATIASTRIADVSPISDHTLYIQGKEIGTTNISIFGNDMRLVEVIDLDVTPDTDALQREIRASAGVSGIRVSSSHGLIVLTGLAPDAVAADRAVQLARSMAPGLGQGAPGQAGPGIVNAMVVAPSQQVMLKVRFLEATRAAERDLGVNWFGTNSNGTRGFSTGLGVPALINGQINVAGTSSAGSGAGTVAASTTTDTGGISVIKSAGALLAASGGSPFGVVLANLVNHGGANIDVMISALETKGLVRRLAEPNLIALSGDTARFLAGGSFPIPTISSTTTGTTTPTFQMQDFGVSLSFVPTVLSGGQLNLRIAPEVSELDFANAVTISGTTIPSLVKRNAQTTIEIRDGQSFAIAGLLQTRDVRDINQVPWLGSVPVIGALFRSSSYQKSETDLVIIVTPHLVHPTIPGQQLASPLDERLPSNDVDFFVNGQTEVPKRFKDFVSAGGDVRGPYGHIISPESGLGSQGAVVK